VFPEQLEEAEHRQGVTLGEGDAFLLYTGAERRIAEEGVHPKGHTAGLSASCAAWLHERGAALVGSDALNDVSPSGYESPDLIVPIHVIGLVAMGLWLADNLSLVELAATCAELGRHEFLFTLAPLKLLGSTSSPINPLAMF
jgi:kynurenine formamidase